MKISILLPYKENYSQHIPEQYQFSLVLLTNTVNLKKKSQFMDQHSTRKNFQ